MSFASPVWLAALALVPAAIAASIWARRRATRYAVRFPALATARLAAETSGSAWLRHLPAALALAAVAALALTLAQPRVSYAVPLNEGAVMLVSDESGSMAATDVQPTRLAAAEQAANTFIDQLPTKVRVGAIAFSSSANAVQAPSADHNAARSLIGSQTASGATATGDALRLALQLLDAGSRKRPPSAIVLLSDGSANAGVDVHTIAREAGRDRIPIDTVALGTLYGTLPNPDPLGPPVSVPPDPQLMQQIARLSRGQTFNAQSADQLSSIYKRLGRQLGTVTRKRDVTAEFAAGALALLLLAAVASTRWSGRLP
jgi:Ca-activated chloride channel family protein